MSQSFADYRKEVESQLDTTASPSPLSIFITLLVSLGIVSRGFLIMLTPGAAERGGLFLTAVGAAVVAVGVLVGQLQVYPESARVEASINTRVALNQAQGLSATPANKASSLVERPLKRYLANHRWLSVLQGISIACNGAGAIYLAVAAVWLSATAK